MMQMPHRPTIFRLVDFPAGATQGASSQAMLSAIVRRTRVRLREQGYAVTLTLEWDTLVKSGKLLAKVDRTTTEITLSCPSDTAIVIDEVKYDLAGVGGPKILFDVLVTAICPAVTPEHANA
jgi:hypothetical protein